MRRRNRILTLVAGLALALAAPSVAGAAKTYCVNMPASCVDGGGLAAPSIGDAITAANTDADDSTIQLGPGTPEAPGTFGYDAGPYAPAEPVTIAGSGSTTTVVGTAVGFVFVLPPGSVLRDIAARAQVGAIGAVQVGLPGAVVALQRVRLTGIIGLDVTGGAQATVDSSLVSVLAGSAACGLRSSGAANPGVSTLTARNVTLTGDGSTQSALCAAAADSQTATLTARSVAIDNLATHVTRSEATTASVATVDVGSSTFDPAKVTQSGGSVTVPVDQPNILPPADSPFVDRTEPVNGFRLRAGVPLLDAGDPAALGTNESATDLDGNPRIAGARRDIGAYERQPESSTGSSGTTGGSGTTGTTTPPAETPINETDPGDETPGRPEFVVAQRELRVSNAGRLLIKVGCFGVAGPKYCTGRITATTTGRYTLAAPRKPRRDPKTGKTIKPKPRVFKRFAFGSVAYKVQVQRSGALTVRIPTASMTLLRREGVVRIRLRSRAAKGSVARASRAAPVVIVRYAAPQRRTTGR